MAHTGKPPAPSRTLVELATELVINILEQLDGKTLVCCRQVCRFLKELVDESIVLQYKIELAIAGMEEGAPSDTSVADRRRRLQKYTTAWAELKWESVERIRSVGGDLRQLNGGVLAFLYHRSSLFFHKLPGHTRGIEGKKWWIDNVGFEIHNYKMDPSQDLLAMIEVTQQSTIAVNPSIKVHLRTLCTGKPHPLCTNPAIVVPECLGPDLISCIILSGDNIGIEVIHHMASHWQICKYVIVWNWKSSRIRAWIEASKGMIRSFSFLTDRHLLLAISRDNETRLEVYDMERTLPTKVEWTGTDYLCAFLYPDTYPDTYGSLRAFKIRSDPYLSWNQGNVEAPFFTARNNRALSVTFDSDRIIHFIPSSVLCSRLSRIHAHEKAVFAWEEWGPAGTSMVEMPVSQVCYTYGSRYVHWSWSVENEAATVLDFNVVARKPESHVRRGVAWKNMETSLPFNSVDLTNVSFEEYSCTQMMISEDNLIVFSETDDEEVYHVLTI